MKRKFAKKSSINKIAHNLSSFKVHIFFIGLAFLVVGIAFTFFHRYATYSYAVQPTVGSWTSLGLNISLYDPSVDPNSPNIIYVPIAGSPGGIEKSVDRGSTWSVLTTAVGGYGPVIVDPRNSNILYDGSISADFFKTTDGGVTWTNLTANNPTLPHPFKINTLVIDPNNPNILYAGNYQSGGIWKSTDDGTTWVQTGLHNDIALILVDPTNSNIIYATTADSTQKSTDGGVTWTRLSPPGGRGIAIDPNNHNVLYVTTGNGGGIYKTTDGGANWAILPNSPQGVINYALITDPIRPNTVYAGNSHDNGFYMSTDGGASWSNINTGLPNVNIYFTLIPTNNPNVLYTTTSSGIYVYGLSSPPVVGIQFSPNGSNGWFTTSPATGTVTATSGNGMISSINCTGATLSNVSGYGTNSASGTLSVTAQGTTTITCTATDNHNLTSNPQQATVKLDSTPPTCTATANPNSIWPPDHKLVNVNVTVTPQDTISGLPSQPFTLLSVTSNESITSADYPGFTPSTPTTSGQIREERNGDGNGRVYTLSYQVTNIAGNTNACQATVTVPHNQ